MKLCVCVCVNVYAHACTNSGVCTQRPKEEDITVSLEARDLGIYRARCLLHGCWDPNFAPHDFTVNEKPCLQQLTPIQLFTNAPSKTLIPNLSYKHTSSHLKHMTLAEAIAQA